MLANCFSLPVFPLLATVIFRVFSPRWQRGIYDPDEHVQILYRYRPGFVILYKYNIAVSRLEQQGQDLRS
jgi:hypothetical protein